MNQLRHNQTKGERRKAKGNRGLAFLACLVLWAWAPALMAGGDDTVEAVEPPIVGRPENFSGAVGVYRLTMRAQPTTLLAEDPLTLTVRITGRGALEKLPRPNLGQLPSFTRRFKIENLKDRYLSKEQAREFDYRLRPKNATVKQIPPLPFGYFQPGFSPDYRGYQTTIAPAIPLTVKPRAVVEAAQVEGATAPITSPDSVYQCIEGSTVLRHDKPFALPGSFLLAAMFFVPPVLCLLGYSAWRRGNPEAARQLHQRRSRAAQQALKALAGLIRMPRDQQAPRAEVILAEYLRKRLDLTTQEPTPAEVAVHLQRAGASPALGQLLAQFFAVCAAARFAPGLATAQDDWPATATSLLLALEAESWPSQAS